MRRPNICNNSVGVADDAYKPTQQSKEEGRVSLMRRMLGGGHKKKEGTNSTTQSKYFGVPLTDMPLTNHTVPKALHRICTYIEIYGMNVEGLFRMSGGTPAVVENLKLQFNMEGDAELETCGDVTSVASLLKLWLKELPQPLLSQEITSELVSLMHKYEGDNWWGPVCYENISTCGKLPTNVLDTILSLLNNYTTRYPDTLSYIPGVFCPLLTCAEYRGIATPDTVQLTTKLIQDYNSIFNKRDINRDNIENSMQEKCNTDYKTVKHAAIVITENNPTQKHRKRKDRHDSCIRLDRKFVRSNSEERPTVKTNCGENRIENMRRVSSHEDFSKSNRQLPLTKLDSTHQVQTTRNQVEPLHEHNACSPQEPVAVGYTSELFDENEHERRRDSERFAPQHHHPVTRHRHHKIKHHKHHSTQHFKENEYIVEKPKSKFAHHEQPMLQSDNSPNEKHNVGQPMPVARELPETESQKGNQDEEQQPLSPLSGFYSPTLDLNTLQEVPNSEPVTSTPPWTNITPSDERMVSPRNSLVVSRRVFTAALTSHGIVDSESDTSVLDINTQISNLKRKLKKYEEGFEREFGYKPSHADKMANPDTRKMCSLLSKLRKQLKYVKEEIIRQANTEKRPSAPVLKEDVVREIEKRLSEKRLSGGRGEVLEEMTHEQLIEEKAAMQKSLLQLENTFGRPSSKEDRDLVRPLYDRYRLLKRILLRHAPSKMKDSISELGTILEHETMEFNPSPPSTAPPSPPREASPRGSIDESIYEEKPYIPGPKLDNLHSLPRHELLELQRKTREEKKQLRRELREFEVEYQAKTGRKLQKEDRHPMEPTYTNYKNAKAKLKFIDALVTKKK